MWCSSSYNDQKIDSQFDFTATIHNTAIFIFMTSFTFYMLFCISMKIEIVHIESHRKEGKLTTLVVHRFSYTWQWVKLKLFVQQTGAELNIFEFNFELSIRSHQDRKQCLQWNIHIDVYNHDNHFPGTVLTFWKYVYLYELSWLVVCLLLHIFPYINISAENFIP